MTRLRVPRILLLAAAASLVVAACGDDDEASSDQTTSSVDETTSSSADDGGGAQEGAITITAFAFDDVTAAAGETIAVVNETGAPHTVTADEGDAFDSGQVAANSEGEVTVPDEPGTYEFHCEVHPSMTGTLTVT